MSAEDRLSRSVTRGQHPVCILTFREKGMMAGSPESRVSHHSLGPGGMKQGQDPRVICRANPTTHTRA